MTYNLPHPEAQSGEIWLSNIKDVDYLALSYTTK